MLETPIFVVHCERINRRNAYYLRFFPNDQLLLRIKELPHETRKWNAVNMVWEVTTSSLYLLIKKYKSSNKIHFDFGNEDSRKIFIKQIKKIDDDEKEKRAFIEDLRIKKEHWVEYKKELEETYEKYSENVHKFLKPEIKLYPHQIVAALFMTTVRNTLLALDMGTGKAQPLDSLLLTPNGWIKMGNIKVGDYVIGSDGKPKKVTAVYPQGLKDTYEVFFNDKTSTKCCDEHLWLVNTPLRISRTKKGKIYPYFLKTTKELLDSGLYDKAGNRKYFIPIIKPVEFEKKELLIDPYILGCLLGDGSITTSSTINFTSMDDEIINEIRNKLPENHNIFHSGKSLYDNYIVGNKNINLINRALKEYKLKGCNSYTKFIPDAYKFSSIEQRLEILRGLLDTDGYNDKSNIICIILASKQLILDIQFIIQSLGGIGRINKKYVKYKGERRLYYLLNMKLPPNLMPFKLKRKVNSYVPVTKYLPNRGISDIKYVGKSEMQCILIDSEDHLYATNDCILTHNSLSAIAACEMNGFKKVIIITPNSLKFNYYNEVKKFTNSNAYIVNWKKNTCSIEDAKYVILNYEFFSTSKERAFEKWKSLKIDVIDGLILDECQRIKNNGTLLYKNYKRVFNDKIFRDGKRFSAYLSGTPMVNRAKELYTVLHEISPIEFSTKNHFYEYYLGMKYDVYNGYGWETDEAETKFEELFHKIEPFVYRKKIEDVIKNLPSKSYQKVMLELDDNEQKTYDEIELGIFNDFTNKEEKQKVIQMLRLRQFTSEKKIKYLYELIDNVIESGEKLVIFDVFKDSLKKINEKYKNVSVLHTGDQTVEERNDAINKFQDKNSEIMIFLSTFSSGNFGITLTEAHKMFLLTLPYSLGEYSQAFSRIYRIGQMHNVILYLIMFYNTIDTYVYDLIESKQDEISQVLDNTKYESDVNVNVFSDVVQKIKDKYNKK